VNAKLTRYPFPASEEDYAHASGELEGRLRGLPGVVAVYRTGSVSAPGISDLDRIAVIQPGSPVPDIWPTLSASTRALAMHGPFLVDATTFARHRWFAELRPLDLIWGDEIELEARPAPERVEPMIAAENLVIVMLSLVKQVTAGRVKVRPTLCQLNGVRHDLDLGRLERADAPRAWGLADQVTRLREEWWRLSPSDRPVRFRTVIEPALAATAEALRALATRMDHGSRPGQLRLSGAWRNVTLVAGEPPAEPRPGALWPVTARSARVAEAAWRWRQRSVAVPGEVISLLDRPPGYEDVHAERQEIVRRYARFLAATEGYSAIGAAGAFAR
jgi:hypothetical protein